MTSSKALAIRAAIEERYGACAVMPYGTCTTLGNEFGVTREYARQIALAMGKPGPGRIGKRNPRPACASCGTEMSLYRKNPLCADCLYIEIPCAWCEKPKRVLASDYVRRLGRTLSTPTGPATYTGRVFCDRRCFATWVGKRNRKQKEPAA